ncbi:MAG TPA: sterol desaturase family protein [Polyangiaceae bacterium]|nr:sterol desaturase family protein [Polyangiaceae bacterium]
MRVTSLADPAPPLSSLDAPEGVVQVSEQASERRRAAIVGAIPGWYNPAIHLAIPTVFGLCLMIGAALRIHELRWLELLTIPITLFASFGFEWRAHKYVLHKRRPLLGLLYERHELMHHVIFTYDRMAMRSKRELWLILMPAYAIVLVFAMVLPLALLLAHFLGENTALLMIITSMAFFLSYEWLHMAYHMPEDSRIGRMSVIRRLREQHRRHHEPRLMKRWNFNVTFPVFDGILGTAWSPAREAALEQRRSARRARAEANAASRASGTRETA